MTPRLGGAIAKAAPFWGLALLLAAPGPLTAQTPPSEAEIAAYGGLHAAAATGDATTIARLIRSGADPNARDSHGRTPLHVAIFRAQAGAARALAGAGADPRALESGRYDIVTIAAVRNDLPGLRLALALGGDPRAVTSIYDGTALIAAAHLGHDGVVRILIEAGAPLDHVNNLGWTALIEAVVLGDGGRRHVETVRHLLAAGANANLADRQGTTPLAHARSRGYADMVQLIERAGGR